MAMRHPTEECIEWNESALAASRESENIEFEKNNLLSLGIQLHSLGHYDKAIENTLKMLKPFQASLVMWRMKKNDWTC